MGHVMAVVERMPAAGPHSLKRLLTSPEPASRREWLSSVWTYRDVLRILARSDFHVRYKRASFGVLWAVAIPLIQAMVVAVVFSQVAKFHEGFNYPAYVVMAVMAWAYFLQTVTSGSTAIVDGSGMAEKVWFPRALLVLVHCLANLPGLLISLGLVVIALPIFGIGLGLHTLMLLPGLALLFVFSMALAHVLAALHVYFRDVRYLVQAATVVFFYLTPIIYPQKVIGAVGQWLDLNPLTGIVNAFHYAAVGQPDAWTADLSRSLAVSVIATVILLVAAVESHRRRDRLFIDLL